MRLCIYIYIYVSIYYKLFIQSINVLKYSEETILEIKTKIYINMICKNVDRDLLIEL